MNKRRWAFTFLVGFFWILKAQAFSLPHIYGSKPAPQFVQAFYQRILQWSQNQWPEHFKQLTNEERLFLEEWSRSPQNWGYVIDDQQIFENLTIASGMEQNKITAPYVFIALTHWPDALKQKLHTLIQRRARKLSSQEMAFVYGIGWDLQAQTFEVHFLHESHKTVKDNTAVKTRAQTYTPPTWHTPLKHIEIYTKDKIKKEELLQLALQKNNYKLFPKKLPLDLRAAQQMVALNGTRQWKWYLRSFYLPLVDPKIYPVVQSLRSEFQLSPQSITFTDTQTFRIFYP